MNQTPPPHLQFQCPGLKLSTTGTFCVTIFSPSGFRVLKMEYPMTNKICIKLPTLRQSIIHFCIYTYHACMPRPALQTHENPSDFSSSQSKKKRVAQLGMLQRGLGGPTVPVKTVNHHLSFLSPQVLSLSVVIQHKGACFLSPSLSEGFSAVSSLLRQ